MSAANNEPSTVSQPPRSRILRRLLLATLATAAATALWHGVYVPVWLLSAYTMPMLTDRAVKLEVASAVISLLPAPRIRLLDAQLTSTLTDQPLARAGLLALTFRLTPGADRWLELQSFSAKAAEVWIDQSAAEGSNWSAWTRVPPRKDRQMRLPDNIEFQNSFIYFKNSDKNTISAAIDQFRLNQNGDIPSSLAVRLQHPEGGGNLQITGILKTEDNSWQLKDVNSTLSGQFDGFPWSLVTAIETVRGNTHNPMASLTLTHFRSYLKRDDDPDEHQAVFSAVSTRWQAADGRLFFRQAEWTYTHEKAEAWSFDADADLALGTLRIRPARIPGSEAIEAEPQTHLLWCRQADRQQARPDWIWMNGWFDSLVSFSGLAPNTAAGADRSPPASKSPPTGGKTKARQHHLLTCRIPVDAEQTKRRQKPA